MIWKNTKQLQVHRYLNIKMIETYTIDEKNNIFSFQLTSQVFILNFFYHFQFLEEKDILMDVINETGATNHTPSQWEAINESINLYFMFIT